MQDDRFELHQLYKSALLRLINERASAIDQLCVFPALLNGEFSAEFTEIKQAPRDPLKVLDQASREELPQVLEKAKRFAELEYMAACTRFWKSVSTYIELDTCKNKEFPATSIVEPDVSQLIGKETIVGLKTLELRAKQFKSDPEYADFWQEVVEKTQKKAAILTIRAVEKEAREKSSAVAEAHDSKPEKKDSPFRKSVVSRMTPDEEVFDSLVQESSDGYLPEYVNRVVYGETSNYQAHNFTESYLSSRVTGYKFALYYPRLADSKEVPKYDKVKQNDGTILVKFSANGYRTLSFRILDEPWDMPRFIPDKFKANFENGVLRLEFVFKPHYYRK